MLRAEGEVFLFGTAMANAPWTNWRPLDRQPRSAAQSEGGGKL